MTFQPIFREAGSGREVAALSHAKVMKSSSVFGWTGIQVEIGSSRGWNVDNLVVNGHCLAMNLEDRSLHFQVKYEAEWTSVHLPPLSFWLNPDGRKFSIARNDGESQFACCFIEGQFLNKIVGHDFELSASNALSDPLLANIFKSIINILNDGNPCPKGADEYLIKAFLCTLAARHGRLASRGSKGGIAPARLKSLLWWLQDNLHRPLSVQELALRVGLSPAHFSREFKRSTGQTPWEYVVQLRIEGARRLLEAGEPLSHAALHFGFADQSHMTKLFKMRFGVTPHAFVKTLRSGSPGAAVTQ